MAQSEEGSECGVDEDLSRDIRSLRAVLDGDDLSYPGGEELTTSLLRFSLISHSLIKCTLYLRWLPHSQMVHS